MTRDDECSSLIFTLRLARVTVTPTGGRHV